MRLLKTIRNTIVATAVLCVAGAVAYQFLLDEEAKEGLRSVSRAIADSYTTLSTLVDEHIGTLMDEDVVAQNRQDIRDKWAELGF